MSESHQDDIAAILAATNSISKEEALSMNATDAIVNLFSLFVADTSLEYMYENL